MHSGKSELMNCYALLLSAARDFVAMQDFDQARVSDEPYYGYLAIHHRQAHIWVAIHQNSAIAAQPSSPIHTIIAVTSNAAKPIIPAERAQRARRG